MTLITDQVVQNEAAKLKTQYLRQKRTQGLNKADLAKKCGWTSVRLLNRLLTANEALTKESLISIASALEVDPGAISTRLFPYEGTAMIRERSLSVYTARPSKDGVWINSEFTGNTIQAFGLSPEASALLMIGIYEPENVKGWVLLLDPAASIQEGDYVVCRLPRKKRLLARVLDASNLEEISICSAIGETYTQASKCTPVVTLLRASCVEKPRMRGNTAE
tara:strand:+ start:12265 stop:12927 length:663 start_codon:yes stop_codon:yes gene_type:complete